MALWGISTTTETAANNYAIPKFNHEVDRNRSPWNTFADTRGWIQRRYKTTENSGISTRFYDEVLVPVAGLNTAGSSSDTGATGLNSPNIVAVFFEDPNLASPISIGAGGTTGIGTGRTGYIHVVWNENVFCSAGATVRILPFTAAGVSTGSPIVATAASIAPGVTVYNYVNDPTGIGGSMVGYTNYNGQISNRVAFAFTAPNTGIGTVLTIDLISNVSGTITAFSGAIPVKTLISDYLHNVGGAGTTGSVGIGTTTLTVTA